MPEPQNDSKLLGILGQYICDPQKNPGNSAALQVKNSFLVYFSANGHEKFTSIDFVFQSIAFLRKVSRFEAMKIQILRCTASRL